MKTLFFWLHKQAGLWLAVFFVILGLSGSALVFMRNIEPVLHQELLNPPKENVGSYTDADSAMAAFKSQPGSDRFGVARLYLPSDKDNVYRIVAAEKGGKGDWYFHYVSPYNSEYLGSHLVKTYQWVPVSMPIMRFVLQLHMQLVAGGIGALFMGLVGICFFLTTLIGFYLWWPKNKNWKKAFSVSKSGNITRLFFDLHKQVGFWAGLVLCLITFTGIYHSFPSEFTSVVKLVASDKRVPELAPVKVVDSGEKIQPYVDYAKGLYPEHQNIQVFFGGDRLDIRLSQPGEINKTEGKTVVGFSYPGGELLKNYEPAQESNAQRFINWMLPLHNGEALGLFGRIIVFIAGLVPLFLFITGFWVFYKKYRAKNEGGFKNFIVAVFSFK